MRVIRIISLKLYNIIITFTKFFKILTTLGAAASLIISKNYFIDTKISRFEIPTLL